MGTTKASWLQTSWTNVTGSILAVPWNIVMGVLRMCKMAATLQPEGAVWGPNMEPFSEARSLKLCPGLDF